MNIHEFTGGERSDEEKKGDEDVSEEDGGQCSGDEGEEDAEHLVVGGGWVDVIKRTPPPIHLRTIHLSPFITTSHSPSNAFSHSSLPCISNLGSHVEKA